MTRTGRARRAAASIRQEALEVRVAAEPGLATALAPVVAAFARLAGLAPLRARALTAKVVALLAAAARGKRPVRLRLMRRPEKLRVRLQCGGRSDRMLRKARSGRPLDGLSVETAARGVLVLTLDGPFRGR